ncbi:MAG: adenine phosphoribosyltransferase [Alphaproteobacteria bacterium]|nr:adenine phosphoribosyltransferase [Alphaproteobacteria bacterium]
MSEQSIKNSIRNIPDFPKKGIQFKDITTALKNAEVLKEILDTCAEHYRGKKIDYVVGIESRGFIFGTALAYILNCGFIPIRKPGKLPADVIAQEYALEYGTDCIEMHADALSKGDKVLIVDDLLATGGTAKAAADLVRKLEAEIAGFAFVIELNDLHGRDRLASIADVYSVVQY